MVLFVSMLANQFVSASSPGPGRDTPVTMGSLTTALTGKEGTAHSLHGCPAVEGPPGQAQGREASAHLGHGVHDKPQDRAVYELATLFKQGTQCFILESLVSSGCRVACGTTLKRPGLSSKLPPLPGVRPGRFLGARGSVPPPQPSFSGHQRWTHWAARRPTSTSWAWWVEAGERPVGDSCPFLSVGARVPARSLGAAPPVWPRPEGG